LASLNQFCSHKTASLLPISFILKSIINEDRIQILEDTNSYTDKPIFNKDRETAESK